MDVKRTAEQLADTLWDLLTDDRMGGQSVQHLSQDPNGFLASQGHEGITSDDFEDAIDRLCDRLGPDQLTQVAPIRSVAQSLPVAPPAPVPTPAPTPIHQVVTVQHAAAAPQVIRRVNEQQVTHVHENVVRPEYVTHNATTNHFVREGDVVTDNRVITQIEAAGDVDFDQKVENHTTTALKGGVAVDGDVEDSVINTGVNRGVIAGDDADLEDSIVGDDNMQVNDSEVGALSGRGNATNLEGENINAGSGDLVDVDADGDAQVATGHGNQLTDDVELDLRDTDGPVDVAIGDRNAQRAVEDDSTRTEDSFNRDASTDGSHNVAVEDSFDTTTSDDDTTSTTVEGSMNRESIDDDTTIGTASETVASSETVMDGDTATFDWEGHTAESTALTEDDQLHAPLDGHDDLDSWDDQDDEFDDDAL